ncbi:hypothetical protein [Halorubrum sp. Atlit-26R]|uniref:hypothetical protein n=1 Tax=Halorubrum sp. Atlit-26R TaxID=2282128 RepID=UPI000EF200B5|nr:hypothetical protein [Halorubrum sp. Atlit-26R]RLM62415.1 hypothetical protein DVK07_19170 [Halorubrum sp. Atlit-26R]
MEETNSSTDHYPEPGTHATECGTITTVDENAILKISECDGCGEQHVKTRAYIDVLVLTLGVIATTAIFTEGLISSPEWTAETVTAVNAVLGTGAGIGTAWHFAHMPKTLEINEDESQ